MKICPRCKHELAPETLSELGQGTARCQFCGAGLRMNRAPRTQTAPIALRTSAESAPAAPASVIANPEGGRTPAPANPADDLIEGELTVVSPAPPEADAAGSAVSGLPGKVSDVRATMLGRAAASAQTPAPTPGPVATGSTRQPLFAPRPAFEPGEPTPAPRALAAPKGVEPAAKPMKTMLFGKSPIPTRTALGSVSPAASTGQPASVRAQAGTPPPAATTPSVDRTGPSTTPAPAFVAHPGNGSTPPPMPARVTRDRLHASREASADSPRPAASVAPVETRTAGAGSESGVDVDMDEPESSASSATEQPVSASASELPAPAPTPAASADATLVPPSQQGAGDTPPPTSQVSGPTGQWLAEHVHRPARSRRIAILGGSAVLIAVLVGAAALRSSGRPAADDEPPGAGDPSAQESAAPEQVAVIVAPPENPTELPGAHPAPATGAAARYRVTQLSEPAAPETAPAPRAEPASAKPAAKAAPPPARESSARRKPTPVAAEPALAAPAPTARPSRTAEARPRKQAAAVVAAPSGKAAAAGASPEAATAAYKRGNERMLAGDAAGALKAFDEAIGSDARMAVAHRGFGLAHAQLGHRALALKSLRTYLRLAPSAPDRDLIQSRIRLLAP